MKTIWKFPIEIADVQEIMAPGGSTVSINYVGLDPTGTPCIWCEVEPAKPKSALKIYVVGTGHPIPEDGGRFVGTFVQPPFVWHVYADVLPF